MRFNNQDIEKFKQIALNFTKEIETWRQDQQERYLNSLFPPYEEDTKEVIKEIRKENDRNN